MSRTPPGVNSIDTPYIWKKKNPPSANAAPATEYNRYATVALIASRCWECITKGRVMNVINS